MNEAKTDINAIFNDLFLINESENKRKLKATNGVKKIKLENSNDNNTKNKTPIIKSDGRK